MRGQPGSANKESELATIQWGGGEVGGGLTDGRFAVVVNRQSMMITRDGNEIRCKEVERYRDGSYESRC
jgi:hypothetical protein